MTKTKAKPQKKRASLLRTAWIAIASLSFVANTCLRAVTRSFVGKSTRPWVDAEMQRWTKRMMRLWRINCNVYNPSKTQPKPGCPTIIMCNHSSLLDIPLTYHAFPNISLRMLAKKELMDMPVMGHGMRVSEFPSVDRKNRRQAIQDMKSLHRLLESGIVMWIAPEGSRPADGRVAAFKKGGFITAINTGATIIPIGIRGAFDILPARTHHAHLNQTAEVHIGEPVDASKFTLENKDELIEQVRNTIKNLTGETS
jgi:1-acyl-sn-glycerol-3-phosphate acyltransferase